LAERPESSAAIQEPASFGEWATSKRPRGPQEYGSEGSSLPRLTRETTGAKSLLEQFRMTTFNRVFTTERLLQIILVLAATFIMKLYS
jgi:hypothetical protein